MIVFPWHLTLWLQLLTTPLESILVNKINGQLIYNREIPFGSYFDTLSLGLDPLLSHLSPTTPRPSLLSLARFPLYPAGVTLSHQSPFLYLIGVSFYVARVPLCHKIPSLVSKSPSISQEPFHIMQESLSISQKSLSLPNQSSSLYLLIVFLYFARVTPNSYSPSLSRQSPSLTRQSPSLSRPFYCVKSCYLTALSLSYCAQSLSYCAESLSC